MTEITLTLSGMEAQQILDGLCQMGYDYGKRAEAEELKATEFQMDDNEIRARITEARAKRARDKETAAYSAYRKLGKLFLDKGLVT